MEICSFSYDRKEQTATAKTVEVEFKQECEKQMVTVCQPATYPAPAPAYGQNPYGGYGPPPPQEYGVYQQCKEVAQETCYNVPQVAIHIPFALLQGVPLKVREENQSSVLICICSVTDE